MGNLKNDLINAYKEGNFLQVVYQQYRGEQENRSRLSEELIILHNEGLLDVIERFRSLENKSGNGHDFFLTRHILEKILQHLNAPIQSVMDCVSHLVSEAGQDMAATALIGPFIDFCAAEPSRPEESLKQILASSGQFDDLLTATIIAGSRIDTGYYLSEAIKLTEHENIEIRKRAVFSLGSIQYPQDATLLNRAFDCLELSVSKENDDSLLGNLTKSTFNLYKLDKTQEERIIHIINSAMLRGDIHVLYAASELIGFYLNDIPETLVDILLGHLSKVSPEHKGTLDNIDFGLVKLLGKEDPTRGIVFLEGLLLANSKDISLDIFDSVVHEIYKNKKNVLNKLLTRWFLRGDRVLCRGIQSVINKAHDHDILLEIDSSELAYTDSLNIVFFARKTIGYLFFKPVTAASVIVSLMHHTTDDETLNELGELLFYPLLVNFSGKVNDYMVQQVKDESGKVKATIIKAIKKINKYLDDLKSTGTVRVLHPSQTHRDAHLKHFSRIMSESFKKAEKESVFLSIVSKSVLLYGKKSICYVSGPDELSNRMETPLQMHGSDVEIPRMELIDPYGLDYMLRVFRAEQRKK